MNSIIQVAQALISFAGILLIAFFALWHVQLVIIVTVIATCIGALAFITVTPKAAFFKFDTSWRSIHFKLRGALTPPAIKAGETSAADSSSIASFARFNFLDSVVSVVLTSAPVWLMGIFLIKTQIGVYAAASYVTLPITTLQTGISVALWPRVAAATTFEGTGNLLRRTLPLAIIAGVGALFYAVFAPLLIPFVFGATYASGIFVAQLLCLAACIITFMYPIGLIAYNLGMVRVSWLINLVGLIIIVTVSISLFSALGPLAAALAVMVAAGFGVACNGIFVWSKVKRLAAQEVL